MLGDFCGENNIHRGHVLHAARLTEPVFKARSCAEGQRSTVGSNRLSGIKMPGMLLAELGLAAKGLICNISGISLFTLSSPCVLPGS